MLMLGVSVKLNTEIEGENLYLTLCFAVKFSIFLHFRIVNRIISIQRDI